MSLIWATRGRTWGFRFLRRGGLRDPLPPYEAAFTELEGLPEGVARVGERVALRFADPDGRTDRSGRVIPHDFVLSGDLAARIHSVADGISEVWPLVAEEYARAWDSVTPPPSSD